MENNTMSAIIMVVKQYLQTHDEGQLKEDLETILEGD